VFANVQKGAEVDVLTFPAPFWRELDGGPFGQGKQNEPERGLKPATTCAPARYLHHERRLEPACVAAPPLKIFLATNS